MGRAMEWRALFPRSLRSVRGENWERETRLQGHERETNTHASGIRNGQGKIGMTRKSECPDKPTLQEISIRSSIIIQHNVRLRRASFSVLKVPFNGDISNIFLQ